MLADPELFEQLSKAVIKALKKLMSWGDSYEIEVEDPRDEIAVVTCVLAINAILQDEKDEDRDHSFDDD